MKRRLFILLVAVLALLVLATGCRKEKSQPAVSQPSGITQEQTEKGQEMETPPATVEQPQVGLQGPEKTTTIPGFSSEAVLIQQIWEQFQKDQGKLKAGQDLSSWLANALARFSEEGKAKSDPSLEAYLTSLLKICLDDPHNPLCQAPWELVRYEIPIYKRTLPSSQLENLQQQFREILKKVDYVTLTDVAIADTASRMVGLLFGDIFCRQNICTFDEVFPQLSRLGNELKLKLFAELLHPIERQALIQKWQPEERTINVVIRIGK